MIIIIYKNIVGSLRASFLRAHVTQGTCKRPEDIPKEVEIMDCRRKEAVCLNEHSDLKMCMNQADVVVNSAEIVVLVFYFILYLNKKYG